MGQSTGTWSTRLGASRCHPDSDHPWGALGCTGKCCVHWDVLGCNGMQWECWVHWEVLGGSGVQEELLGMLRCTEVYWETLGCAGCTGIHWDALECNRVQ